ncbi:MAG TPA: hypothetical protein VGL83_19055 [Stellaceae bacterium]|jgi:hypothetical protein
MAEELPERGHGEYRVYLLGPDCGIFSRHEFTAENDTIALEKARAIYKSSARPHHGFEIWQRSRHVHTEGC